MECLESIKRQTLEDIECIIVDDGSIDGSIENIEHFIKGDARFRLASQFHSGLSAARNLGTSLASSNIVFHLDADDLALPEMMEKASTFLLENSLDMAFFDSEPVNCGIGPHIFEMESRYFSRMENYGIASGIEMLERMLANGDWTYATFIHCFRKSSIKRMFHPGLRAQDELHTAQNLLLMKRVGHLHEVLHHRRCHRKCITYSRHDGQYAWSRMKTALELLKMAEENGISSWAVQQIAEKCLNGMRTALREMKDEDVEWMQSLPLMDRMLLKTFLKAEMSVPLVQQSEKKIGSAKSRK